MFKKILIANRGEIACRIIRSARDMGIKTVAVFSEADADAKHADMADEAVAIGPPEAAKSYLDGDRIIRVAKDTGAEAIHPGYGFLSENAKFVKAVEAAGLTFIGPAPKAIAAMGDKIESKKIAEKAGVNTIPGSGGEVKSAASAVKIARDIGLPVMIKASAGGGGKGMRVARSEDEVKEGFSSARSEAKSSFGDERVFIEKFIESPRHIEIQVLADTHGTVIHLGERECSIQRRHQKVIEEAPSPFLDDKTRSAMGEQAVALARAVDYRSAGTVEFIVDKDRNFYFLEMNTRLQVEHPVTEMVTGIDLVEAMIRVADGEKLWLSQDDVQLKGWAVEARVYAEDPYRGFLPSIGRLKRYEAPENGGHIRVDDGVREGAEISMFYDPMIAKLIAYGESREDAVDRLALALDSYAIRGIQHNIPFLSAVAAHPRFRAGELTTHFIEEEYPDGFQGVDLSADMQEVFAAVASFANALETSRASQIAGRTHDMESPEGREWHVFVGEKEVKASLTGSKSGANIAIGKTAKTLATDWVPGKAAFRGTWGNDPVSVELDSIPGGWHMASRGMSADVRVFHASAAEQWKRMPVKEAPDTSKLLLCPMPGLLVALNVGEGDEVAAGQGLCVVEAMKMENILRAERDGMVKEIKAEPGQSLAVDDVIMEFE